MAIKINELDLEIVASVDKAIQSIDGLANSLKKLKGANPAKEVKEVNSTIKEVAKSSEVSGEAVKEVAETVGSFGSKLSAVFSKVGVVFEAAKKAIHAIVQVLKKALEILKKIGSAMLILTKKLIDFSPAGFLSKGLTGIVKKLSNLQRMIVRIATYRAIRTVIKLITQGFTEGFNNAYKWAEVTGQKLAPAMDRLAASALYLKNAIGAVAGNIFEDFADSISAVIDRLAEAFNALSRFYSMLTGKAYYYKALKTLKKFGDEVKRQLFGFDELNVLNGDQSNYGGMFEKVETDAEEATNAFESLTQKINGWIQNLDLAAVGSKLGTMITEMAKKINGFVSKINFFALGQQIADGLNNLFANIDPTELGELLSQKINAVFSLAQGFVTQFLWADNGAWLGDVVASWFNSIEWNVVADAISKAINGLFEFAKNFIAKIDPIEIATTLGKVVNSIVSATNWREVGHTIGKWIDWIITFVDAFLREIDWKQLGGKIEQFIEGLDFENIFARLTELIKTAIGGMFDALIGYIGQAWKRKSNKLAGTDYFTNFDYVNPNSVNGYANGGYPQQGELFIAGERGVELVSSVGGQTSVTNENQLVAGFEAANEVVVQATLAIGNAIVNAINSKTTTIELDGATVSRQLYQAMQTESTRRGNSLVQGV